MKNEQEEKIINIVQREKSEILTKRLKEEIKKLGYTQEKVADKVGISPSSITKYLKGICFPDNTTLEALAKLFGVSTNYLIGKADCPTYTFEDIKEKTGLSQKAIEKLYQLQHDYFLFEDIEIDIQEKRKISKQYKEHLDILNSMIENFVDLFWLLDNIRKYKSRRDEIFSQLELEKKNKSKDLAIHIIDAKEELATLADKIQRSFKELTNEIVKR